MRLFVTHIFRVSWLVSMYAELRPGVNLFVSKFEVPTSALCPDAFFLSRWTGPYIRFNFTDLFSCALLCFLDDGKDGRARGSQTAESGGNKISNLNLIKRVSAWRVSDFKNFKN